MVSSTRPDLLLINPPSRKQVYQSLAEDFSAIEPPVWAGLMASYSRHEGLRVELLDAEAMQWSIAETAREAAALRPRLVVMVVYGQQPSASTQVMPAAGALCREIKSLDPTLPILMVGGHVAALPARTLREEAADFTCGGEGLTTMVALARMLKQHGTDWAGVPDLYHRVEGKVAEPRVHAPLTIDLDTCMPGLAWDLIPVPRYRAHNWHCLGSSDASGRLERSPYASIYTSLGCPFHCHFCCIQAPFRSGESASGMASGRNSYRMWGAKRVVDDCEMLASRYGVKHIKFADELFLLNRSHVEGICDEIIRRGLELNIWAYARVDTVDARLLDKLKRAGINWLALGIESGAERVRDDVHKGFKEDQLFLTMSSIKQAGIAVIGNYIFGLPEDDLASMQATLDLALELKCEFANFYSAMAYPGSKLFDMAMEQGLQLPESWSGYSQHAFDTLPLPTRHLSGPEVLRFRDGAFQTYFSHPDVLSSIRTLFGPGAETHIRHMVAQPLPRKFT